MKEQVIELRSSTLVQTDNLAIDDCLAVMGRSQLICEVESNELKGCPLREMSSASVLDDGE